MRAQVAAVAALQEIVRLRANELFKATGFNLQVVDPGEHKDCPPEKDEWVRLCIICDRITELPPPP
jgi:hypothetical protein